VTRIRMKSSVSLPEGSTITPEALAALKGQQAPLTVSGVRQGITTVRDAELVGDRVELDLELEVDPRHVEPRRIVPIAGPIGTGLRVSLASKCVVCPHDPREDPEHPSNALST
jgi:hypothetical protein